jgi:hypothetical protein
MEEWVKSENKEIKTHEETRRDMIFFTANILTPLFLQYDKKKVLRYYKHSVKNKLRLRKAEARKFGSSAAL